MHANFELMQYSNDLVLFTNRETAMQFIVEKQQVPEILSKNQYKEFIGGSDRFKINNDKLDSPFIYSLDRGYFEN
jgi:hypothetical protein